MKQIILLTVFCVGCIAASAQFTYKIKADSLLVTNDSCRAEFNLENSTKDVKGFLYNTGNGRTKFQKALIKLSDSTYLIGADTLKITGGSSADAWKLIGNIGTNPSNHFLGTTDSTRLVFRTNNAERATLLANGRFLIGTTADQGNYRLQTNTAVSGHGIYMDASTNAGIGYKFKSKDQAWAWHAENGIAQVGLQNQISGSTWVLDAVNTSFVIQGRSANVTLQTNAFGDLYITTGRKLKLSVGSDATGDMYYRNATGDFTRLPVGSNDDILKVASGIPIWAPLSSTAWSLTGNTGIDPSVNFLGTSDAQPVIFKTNNTQRAVITSSGSIGINTNSPSEKLDIYNGRVKINGVFTSSYDWGPLVIIDSASNRTQYNMAYFKTPNLTDNSRITFQFGKSSSSGNSGFISFSKFTDGSASNYLEFQIAGFANLLKLHANRNVEIGKTAIGLATDDGYRLNVLKSEGSLTTEGRVINASTPGATFNTSSSALNSYGGYFNSNGTRISGSNNLTNIGLFATASGGQVNYALKTDGGVNMTNLASSSDTSVYKPAGINSNGDIVKMNNWPTVDLSNTESFSTSDVSLTANTYSDAVSVSLAAGTWLISGNVTIESPDNTIQQVTYKLWDGSTVYQAGQASSAAMGAGTKGYVSVPVSGLIVLTGNTTIKISIASTTASVVKTTPGDNNAGTTNKATSIRGVRIK